MWKGYYNKIRKCLEVEMINYVECGDICESIRKIIVVIYYIMGINVVIR